MPSRKRGALPSFRHTLAAATPHRIVGDTPPQCLWLPARLSFWGNDVDGDCVTAEEAFAKDCSGVYITDQTVLNFAQKNNLLNGAFLPDVLQLMQESGFEQDGKMYGDGPCSSVDWSNQDVLQNAISRGPVKIGVAADQLERVVPEPPSNGWLATGFKRDTNEDHCVSLCGYGEIGWLREQITGNTLSNSIFAYAMFTWNSIGVIDRDSLMAICGEAWLRNPTTITKG